MSLLETLRADRDKRQRENLLAPTIEPVVQPEPVIDATGPLTSGAPVQKTEFLGDEIAGAYNLKSGFGSGLQAFGYTLADAKPSKVISGLVDPNTESRLLGLVAPGLEKTLRTLGDAGKSEAELQADQERGARFKSFIESTIKPIDKPFEKVAEPVAGALVSRGSRIQRAADDELKYHQGNESQVTRGRDLFDVYSDKSLTLGDKTKATIHRWRQQTPQIAASMLLQATGGPIAGALASGAVTGTSETGSQFQTILQDNPGVDVNDAALGSLAYGIASSIIEQANIGPLLKKAPGAKVGIAREVAQELAKKTTLRKAVTEALEQGSLEALEEATQTLVGNVGQKYFNKDKELTEGLFESAVVGFGPGAATGGALSSLSPSDQGPSDQGLSPGQRRVITPGQRSTAVKDLKQKGLSGAELGLLLSDADKLNALGVDFQDVTNIINSSHEARQEYAQFSALTEAAPNESVRAGILSAIGGAVTNKLAAPEATPEVAPEAAPEATPEATLVATAEAAPVATTEAAPVAAPVATTEAAPVVVSGTNEVPVLSEIQQAAKNNLDTLGALYAELSSEESQRDPKSRKRLADLNNQIERAAALLRPSVTEQVAPITEQATPVSEQVTPVTEQATPIAEQATPETEQAIPVAPVVTQVTPVTEQASPVTEQAAPVTEQAAPVTEQAAPVTEQAAPVTEQAAPVTEQAAPVTEQAAPVTEQAAPVTEQAAPVNNEQLSLKEQELVRLAGDIEKNLADTSIPGGKTKRAASVKKYRDEQVGYYLAQAKKVPLTDRAVSSLKQEAALLREVNSQPLSPKAGLENTVRTLQVNNEILRRIGPAATKKAQKSSVGRIKRAGSKPVTSLSEADIKQVLQDIQIVRATSLSKSAHSLLEQDLRTELKVRESVPAQTIKKARDRVEYVSKKIESLDQPSIDQALEAIRLIQTHTKFKTAHSALAKKLLARSVELESKPERNEVEKKTSTELQAKNKSQNKDQLEPEQVQAELAQSKKDLDIAIKHKKKRSHLRARIAELEEILKTNKLPANLQVKESTDESVQKALLAGDKVLSTGEKGTLQSLTPQALFDGDTTTILFDKVSSKKDLIDLLVNEVGYLTRKKDLAYQKSINANLEIFRLASLRESDAGGGVKSALKEAIANNPELSADQLTKLAFASFLNKKANSKYAVYGNVVKATNSALYSQYKKLGYTAKNLGFMNVDVAQIASRDLLKDINLSNSVLEQALGTIESTRATTGSPTVIGAERSTEAKLVSSWLEDLNLDMTINIMSPTEFLNRLDSFSPAIIKRSRDFPKVFDTSKGALIIQGNAKYTIVLKNPVTGTNTRKDASTVTTLAHEVGHALRERLYDQASLSEKLEVLQAYANFKESLSKEFAKGLSGVSLRLPIARASETSRKLTQKRDSIGQDMEAYYSSFDEWFANETAKALTTKKTPVSKIEKFFKAVALAMKNVLAKIQGTPFVANKDVVAFLEGKGLKLDGTNLGQVTQKSEPVFDTQSEDPRVVKDSNIQRPQDIESQDQKALLLDLLGTSLTEPREVSDSKYEEYTRDLYDKGSQSPNKLVRQISTLLARLDPQGKAFRRDEFSQTTSWRSRLLSSPEYYSSRDTQAEAIVKAGVDMQQKAHELESAILDDFARVGTEIEKRYPAEYARASEYLNSEGDTGKGYKLKFDKEADTWVGLNPRDEEIFKDPYWEAASDHLIEAEVASLPKNFGPVEASYIKSFRDLSNRALAAQIDELQATVNSARQAGLPDPRIAGRGSMTIEDAILATGDIQGTYFPWVRDDKAYYIKLEKPGHPPHLLSADLFTLKNDTKSDLSNAVKELVNQATPVGREIAKLEKQGYTVSTVEPSSSIESRNIASEALWDAASKLMNRDVDSYESEEREALLEIDKIINGSVADVFKIENASRARMERASTYATGFETDANKAMIRHVKQIASGISKRKAAKEMIYAFMGRDESLADFLKANPNASEEDYAVKVSKKKIDPRIQANLHSDMKTYINFMLGTENRAQRIVGHLKTLAVLKYLGLRPSSAAVNMTNMIMAVPATIAAHTDSSLAKAYKAVVKSASVYSAYRSNALLLQGYNPSVLDKAAHFIETQAKQIGKLATSKVELTAQDEKIFDTISERGWDDAHFNIDATRATQDNAGRFYSGLISASMYMFGAAEKANRAMTIYAAYKAHEAKASNANLGFEELMALAKHTSDRAHGSYGKATKPWIVQKAPALDAAFTFMKFQHNYILNTIEMGIKYNNWSAVSLMLASPGVLAGAGASALAPFLFPIVGMSLAALGFTDDEEDPEEAYYEALEEVLPDMLDGFARNGLAGFFNVNFKGSLQMNSPIQDWTIEELAGAPGAVIRDAWDALQYAKYNEWSKAFEKLAPSALAGPVKAYRLGTEGPTGANYAPTFTGQELQKASSVEQALMALSFNPASISASREKHWNIKQVKESFKRERSNIMRERIKTELRFRNNTIGFEKYQEDLSRIEDDRVKYNDRVEKAPLKYTENYLTDSRISKALKQALKPSKVELQF